MRPLVRFFSGGTVCLACIIWLARIEPHTRAPKAAVPKEAPPPLEEPAARRNNCRDQWPKSGRVACQAFTEGRLISNLSDAGLEYPLSADDLGRAWLQRGNSSRLDDVLRQLRCGVATRIAVLGGSVTCGNTMFGKVLPKGTRWTDVWLELLQRDFGPQVRIPPVAVSHAGVWRVTPRTPTARRSPGRALKPV